MKREPALRERDSGELLQRDAAIAGEVELRHAYRVSWPYSSTHATRSPSGRLAPSGFHAIAWSCSPVLECSFTRPNGGRIMAGPPAELEDIAAVAVTTEIE